MPVLRRGDLVQVIAGAERPKRGKILRVHRDRGMVVVQGINLVYKHMRRSQKYPQGGRIQKEAPISISNVMLVDAELDRPVRMRAGRDAQGRKIRVSARSGNEI